MAKMYQVIGECAFVTQENALGVHKVLMMKGAVLGPGATKEEIEHNLGAKLIAEVGEHVTGGVNADGKPDAVVEAETTADETPTAETSVKPAKAAPADPRVEARRADAKAKLDALGGAAPSATHGEDVWVEYAVVQGMDRAEAEKAGKAELRKALTGGS